MSNEHFYAKAALITIFLAECLKDRARGFSEESLIRKAETAHGNASGLLVALFENIKKRNKDAHRNERDPKGIVEVVEALQSHMAAQRGVVTAQEEFDPKYVTPVGWLFNSVVYPVISGQTPIAWTTDASQPLEAPAPKREPFKPRIVGGWDHKS